MTIDFNSADEQQNFDLLPANTLCKLHMTIKAGGVGDGGWLTESKSGYTQNINAEFVVMEGPYAKRKFWQRLTVSGGKVDKRGESIAAGITRATIRAMIESACGISPKDMSEQAQANRRISSYGDLNGIVFAARVGVRPADGEHKAQNQIDRVITPDMTDYAAIMNGASPVQAASAAGLAGAAPAQTPAWQGAARSAPQAPRPAWAPR